MTPAPREDMRAEASFVWLTKAALRRIDEAPTIRSPAAAKLVYLALCWLASDAESNTFTAAIANIATKASLGYRSTWSVITELEKLGLIAVRRPPVRGPAGYTLCTTRRTIGNKCRTFGTGMQHSVAESTECTRKKVEGTPTPPKSRGTAERIAAENRLKILKERLGRLRDDTSEQWQRDEHPELLAEKREVVGQIKALEDSLL